MAFFRTVSFSEPLPIVEGDGVYLRAPQMADFPEWAALRERSRGFLTPWEPTWLHDDLTRGAFRRRLRRYADDVRTHRFPEAEHTYSIDPGELLEFKSGL
jgi:ribosomal-protein-alanine N-acetyltransferase